MTCDYCEPAHNRKMQKLNNVKAGNRRENLSYQVRIGKSWKGHKYKNHRLMLFSHGSLESTMKINYCPLCGRKLGSGN